MVDSPEVRFPGYSDLFDVGRGGEHHVFKQGPLIYKINTLMAKKFLTGEMDAEEVETMALQRQHRHAALRSYIGHEYVYPEETSVELTVLSPETCAAIAPDIISETKGYGRVVPLMVIRQDYLVEIEQTKHHGTLSIGNNRYAEERIAPSEHDALEQYHAAARTLFLGEKDAAWQGEWPSTDLNFEIIAQNRAAFKELHEGASHYTTATGEGLDLIGGFNAFVRTKPSVDQAGFGMIDTLWPVDCKLVADAVLLFLLLNEPEEPELSRLQRVYILNAFNYICLLNYVGLAAADDSEGALLHHGNQPCLDIFARHGPIEWRDDITQRIYASNRRILQESKGLSVIY